MDTKERHVKENNRDNADLIADSLRAKAKNNKNNGTRNVNRLWLWFGVLVPIFIRLFSLFLMGIFRDRS